MAGSIEDAFKEAGFTRDSSQKKIASRNTPAKPAQKHDLPKREADDLPELFVSQMKADGVVPLAPSYSMRSAHGQSARETLAKISRSMTRVGTKPEAYVGRGIKNDPTRRTSPRAGLGELNKYIAHISSVYSPSRLKPTLKPSSNASKALLEIVGKIVASPLLVITNTSGPAMLPLHHDGIASQLAAEGMETDAIDLTLGLDFGTSSVKAVIRDNVPRAFAVPFFYEGAENVYLLPSRIFEFNDRYALTDGGIAHRDLKLSLLRKDCSEKEFECAAAFLALVIRCCRGWLLCEKGDIYRHAQLSWSLNLSLPAANYEDESLVRRFKALAIAAMNLAGAKDKSITAELAKQYCQLGWDEIRRDKKAPRDSRVVTSGDMVDVVPEIAAQIWGFVQSARFDPRAVNHFMMVDVGAGTVDASIFHVRREPGNRTGFVFYANSVEQNGVMNLHRERISWLGEAFSKIERDPNVTNALVEIARPTDRLGPIPEGIADYFDGIKLNVAKVNDNPDEMFFMRRYWRQVFGQTMFQTRSRKLRDSELQDLPCFLTGGGSRMNYFSRLVRRINDNPNCSWASLRQLPLEVPRELVAPGLKSSEYDRLSVAFGLSFLKLGSYVRSQDIPDLPRESPPDYYDRFIFKDQV